MMWLRNEAQGNVNKRDILFLCQFFYPEHNSSATLPFDTAKYLAEKGYSVGVLCGYPKEYTNRDDIPIKETVDGVSINRVRYLQLGREKKLSRIANYCSFTCAALLKVFTLSRYKCVITYTNPPVLPIIPVVANALFGIRVVFVVYDVYPEVAYASGQVRPGSMIDRIMKCLNGLIYKKVSMCVALTNEMKGFLLKNRPKLSEERVTVIANWAHESKVAITGTANERLGYTKDQFVVAYLGNMGTCQELETMFGAIRMLKDNEKVRFLFVGHGNKKKRVEEIASETGNVQVFDFLTGEAFQQVVEVASCYVVSLEKGLLGLCAPSKYYSYLQGGKPVVAIVEEGSYLAKEVTDEKIGRAVTIGDTESLVESILFMNTHSEECSAMGARAASLYEREYRREIGLKKYENVMRRIGIGEK